MRLRLWFALLTGGVAGVAACDAPIAYSGAIDLSTQDSGLEQDGLDAATRQFFGGDVPDDDGPVSDLTDTGDAAVDRTRSRAVTARLRGHHPISSDLALVGELAVSTGSGRYGLPDGLGALTDPAQVSFTSTALDASVGVAHQHTFASGITSEVSTGLGHRLSRTQTRVSSALLDINSTSTDGDQYVFVGARAAYPVSTGTEVYAATRARRYTSGTYDAQVSVGVGFFGF